ncbi:hypothetical protein HNO88_000314 [Novosphingobium chloroacetimidivorans]|uniref:Coat protein n=1 Tax=Novosphingobium chloroacetimidivorans TaxID=1428314 RepID=A0A7W7NVD6_9SPHN|nr:P22 phage major capsid protein family protein [Novosphingobium chloroacetimidivorans]MBB4857017.1 hypothetical protein [Novosphingobium chloroacetimidivorans]
MASSFTKEELTVFDEMVPEFDDLLSYGALARKYEPLSPEQMVHTRDRFWVEGPMIGSSYDGFDQTSNFDGLTEMSVPVSVGFHKSSPKTLSAKNLRNLSAMRNYADAAKLKLASDVNSALRQRVALEGSQFVKRTVAATGFDDLALAMAVMTEQGIPSANRVAMVGVRSGIGMVSNLAGRSEATSRSADAYRTGLVAPGIANFDMYSDDAPIRLTAATGGATTVNGANQYFEPSAVYTEADGEQVNLDNRRQNLTVTAGTYANIKVGDAFTIAGVNSVHMINKQDTGQLQTFRVVGKPSAGVIQISPAIISNGGNTIAGKEYQNVTATPANGAALTWLNTTTNEINPFFVRDSLLLIPGSFTVDPDDGWQVMRAVTPKYGIAITYTRQGDINTLNVKARWDIDFGTSLLNPQFAGGIMFSQA